MIAGIAGCNFGLLVADVRRSSNATDTNRLYPDRIDDCGCDYRHSGRRCPPLLPGLYGPRAGCRGRRAGLRLQYEINHWIPAFAGMTKWQADIPVRA